MLDSIWQGLAIFAALVAGWFGFRSHRLERKIERDKAEREIAERNMIEKTLGRIEANRREWADKAPVDPKRRDDLEGGL